MAKDEIKEIMDHGSEDLDALFADLGTGGEEETGDAEEGVEVEEKETEDSAKVETEEEEESTDGEVDEETPEEPPEENTAIEDLTKQLEDAKMREDRLVKLLNGEKEEEEFQKPKQPEVNPGATVTSYGLKYDPPEITEERFEEILSDRTKLTEFVVEVAQGAAGVQGQNSLLEVGAQIDNRINLHREVAKYFIKPENRDLVKARDFILRRAGQLEPSKPGATIGELLDSASEEVRTILKSTGGRDPKSPSSPKRGKFAKGTQKSKKPAPPKADKAEDAVYDQLQEMLNAG